MMLSPQTLPSPSNDKHRAFLSFLEGEIPSHFNFKNNVKKPSAFAVCMENAGNKENSVLEYEQLYFQELPDANPAAVRVHFSRIFHFDVPRQELERIGVEKVE